jgi:peptidoglycan/xylan/chitin deacetylase (PgdA/CDA1 family)
VTRMAVDPLVPVTLTDTSGVPRAAWALGMSLSLPQSFLDFSGLARHRDSRGRLQVRSRPCTASTAVAEQLRRRAAFTDSPPASARLPFSYQRVPGWARSLYASFVGRSMNRRQNRWAAFPGWPLDLSADLAADLVDEGPEPATPQPAPVLLTHDIDSPEGLVQLVKSFLPLEEAVGARSVNFVVPCGWPVDAGLLREVKRRGHAVGTHGYDHSHRTPFADTADRQRRLTEGKRSLAEYDPCGYRAPSLLRTPALLRDVARLYRFDSSVPTSGGPFPVPNNGCASARPFLLEGVAEIPLSLPRDGSLRFLGCSPDEIARLWIECAAQICRSRGVVVLLTHCEKRFSGNASMLAAYRRFLEHTAASADFRFATADFVLKQAFSDPVAGGLP